MATCGRCNGHRERKGAGCSLARDQRGDPENGAEVLHVVYIKDKMDVVLPKVDKNTDKNLFLLRAATKSTTAGMIGAAITNPFDVLRNEMFKTNLSLRPCLESLFQNEGRGWLARGMAKNMVAVSLPMSVTIFLTDIFCSFGIAES